MGFLFLIFLFVIVPIIVIISVVGLFLYIITQRKTPHSIPDLDKGKQGEYLTFREISGTEQGERILNNLYIPYEQDKLVEIDLVLIK